MEKEKTKITTILEIQSSARKARSITRELSAAFLREWLERQPDTKVITRDFADSPPPFVTEDWIATVFGVKEEDLTSAQRALLAPSDELIAELVQADVIVMATPMYNYGMPAALKNSPETKTGRPVGAARGCLLVGRRKLMLGSITHGGDAKRGRRRLSPPRPAKLARG